MSVQDNYLTETGDGTSTLFMKEYDQAMHSDSGAYEESLLKHLYPSGILELKDKKISVLDVGFGLGYNVLALIYEFRKKGCGSELNIISLEKDRSLLEFMGRIRFNDGRDELYDFIKKGYSSGKEKAGNVTLEIIFGDGRDFIRELNGIKFDAVFQDPFSPSKNPEMWSLDYFKTISEVMKENGILTTYSSADQVRRAMIEAGLVIGAGPSVGRKREGTIASVSGIIEPVDKQRIEEIYLNPRSEPYRDRDLSQPRGVILEERLERIRIKKSGIR